MLTPKNITDPAAQEILKGASELFMRFGVKSITMDEIARHLSISKKTIYQHFTDKDDLVMTFAKESLQKQQFEILEMEKNFENIMEGILHFSEYMRCTVCNINPGLLFDLKKYFPKAWKIFQEHKRTFLKDHVIRVIQKGIKQGYFRKDLNCELLGRMRIEQLELSFNPEVFPPGDFDIKEVHMLMFYHFMFGICTAKGHEEFSRVINNT